MKASPIPPSLPQRKECFLKSSLKDCTVSDEKVEMLESLLIGKHLMLILKSDFVDSHVPHCQVDNAIKNCVTSISTEMMTEKGHLAKLMGSGTVFGKKFYG